MLDANIAELESTAGVTIKRRGWRFRLFGRNGKTDVAARALRNLYERADRQIGRGDILTELVASAGEGAAEETETGAPARVALRKARDLVVARNESQRKYVGLLETRDVTLAIGPAGTGKTFLAVACALVALERRLVKRVVLARPVVEAGENLGFLPGDLEQKINPYLRPLHDAIREIVGHSRAERMAADGLIELAPLAYMRGRTLKDCFAILDEGQNCTVEQMKMFLTRMGSGTRMAVTGDVTQVDLPRRTPCGLEDARARLAGIDGVGVVEFGVRDVVRHPLVMRIAEAYADRRKGG